MTFFTLRAALNSSVAEPILVTQMAEDLLTDPDCLLFLTSVVAWLSTISGSVCVIVPHRDSRVAYEDFPRSVGSLIEAHGGRLQFLRVAEGADAAARDFAQCLANMDDGRPRLVCGPESGGLLSAAAAARRSGISLATTTIAVIPFGIESLQAERRCEFIFQPGSVDRELVERDLLRLADVILVESQLQQDYIRRLEPNTPCRSVQFTPPAMLLNRPPPSAPTPPVSDRVVFLGQFTTAGGIEVLRSVLQDFTRLKRRLNVTLAGCAGCTAYGNSFQFVAEAIADLQHDFTFVLSNDPMVLLDAVDGSSVVMFAQRMALRTPMLDLLRERGLAVVDLTTRGGLENWHDSGSFSQRYVIGRAAAAQLQEAFDAPQAQPQLSASVNAANSGAGAPASDFVDGTRLDRPAVGAGRCALVFCNSDRRGFASRLQAADMSIDEFSLWHAGEAFALTSGKRTIARVEGASVAVVLGAILANIDHPTVAVFGGDALPSMELRHWLPLLATVADRFGVIMGGNLKEGWEQSYQDPPRHLLQPLWHPAWQAPFVLYSRKHLLSLLDDPVAAEHQFSAFALWALSAVSTAQPLIVPLRLSQELVKPRRGDWARLEALRRPLEHVIALANSKRVLPRDLARFIHGAHGSFQLLQIANLASLVTPRSRNTLWRLQEVPWLNGTLWAARMARLLADLGMHESALVLLDKVRSVAKGGEADEVTSLRVMLQSRVEAGLGRADHVLEPAMMAAMAAIDRRVEREASATLQEADIALASETGLDIQTVSKIVAALLVEYAAAMRWDKCNALEKIYQRQFGDLPAHPNLAGEFEDIALP